MRASTAEPVYYEVAAAILFLAGKLGNGSDFCRIEKVIDVCARYAKKGGDSFVIPVGSDAYNYWQNAIFRLEEIILEKLCFDDHPELPHDKAIALVAEFNGEFGLSVFVLTCQLPH